MHNSFFHQAALAVSSAGAGCFPRAVITRLSRRRRGAWERSPGRIPPRRRGWAGPLSHATPRVRCFRGKVAGLADGRRASVQGCAASGFISQTVYLAVRRGKQNRPCLALRQQDEIKLVRDSL